MQVRVIKFAAERHEAVAWGVGSRVHEPTTPRPETLPFVRNCRPVRAGGILGSEGMRFLPWIASSDEAGALDPRLLRQKAGGPLRGL